MAGSCSEPLEGVIEEPQVPGVPPSLEWSTYSGTTWYKNEENKYTSTNKTNNSQSWLELKITAPTECRIMITMSASTSGYDYGYMSKLDGGAGINDYQDRVSGIKYSTYTYSVPAGIHYIYFGYVKRSSYNSNDDNVIVQVMSIN
jgi:hypothetical protein